MVPSTPDRTAWLGKSFWRFEEIRRMAAIGFPSSTMRDWLFSQVRLRLIKDMHPAEPLSWLEIPNSCGYPWISIRKDLLPRRRHFLTYESSFPGRRPSSSERRKFSSFSLHGKMPCFSAVAALGPLPDEDRLSVEAASSFSRRKGSPAPFSREDWRDMKKDDSEPSYKYNHILGQVTWGTPRPYATPPTLWHLNIFFEIAGSFTYLRFACFREEIRALRWGMWIPSQKHGRCKFIKRIYPQTLFRTTNLWDCLKRHAASQLRKASSSISMCFAMTSTITPYL